MALTVLKAVRRDVLFLGHPLWMLLDFRTVTSVVLIKISKIRFFWPMMGVFLQRSLILQRARQEAAKSKRQGQTKRRVMLDGMVVAKQSFPVRSPERMKLNVTRAMEIGLLASNGGNPTGFRTRSFHYIGFLLKLFLITHLKES